MIVAVLAAEVLGALMLLLPAFIGLSFLSETLRRAPLPLVAQCFRLAAILVAFAPLVATIAVAIKFFAAEETASFQTRKLWLPVMIAGGCVPLFVGLLHGVEHQVARARRRAAAVLLNDLRAAVARGEEDRACELVARDPKASPEVMAACRRSVDAQKGPSARLVKLESFVDGVHFRSWNPQELGLSKTWDFNRSYPAVPADHQAWFLETYFAVLAVESGFLATDASREKLRSLVQDVSYLLWTSDARDVFEKRVKPKLPSK